MVKELHAVVRLRQFQLEKCIIMHHMHMLFFALGKLLLAHCYKSFRVAYGTHDRMSRKMLLGDSSMIISSCNRLVGGRVNMDKLLPDLPGQ